MNNQIIFTGNSNPDLAQRIADNLNTKLGAIKVDTFSDGEINVEIQENVRGKDTFIIQSTNNPAHKNIMELVLIADALKRAKGESFTKFLEKAPNTADAMKRYKAGNAGFTDKAHLKAKGLIPRADGTKKVSDKYK